MTSDRRNIASGTVWEDRVGYSRAVRVGRFVFVTGTIAANEKGEIVAPGDAYGQTVAAIEKIERALNEAGATLRDVVRTRMYVTDLEQWEKIAEAHRRFFGDVRPCTTMVEVGRLFADALVEVEVDAIVAEGAARTGRPMIARGANRRIFVLPVTVLLVAGGLWVWSTYVETRRVRMIETSVREICAAAARGESLTGRLPTANPALDRRLEQALAGACSDGSAIDVAVVAGAGPDAPEASATHHALIRVGDAFRIGLRFTARGNKPVIVGYWLAE